MSFASDLKKVTSLDQAQSLFDYEINRLLSMDVYKSSEKRFENRLAKVHSDIVDHLNELGIHGTVYYYVDDKCASVDFDNLEQDKRFFRWLYFGLFVWMASFALIAHYTSPLMQRYVKNSQSNSKPKEEVVSNLETTSSNLVWNPYRDQYTTQDVLDEDEAWVSQE